jgi:Cft2 family RNA processing exonuclease
MQRRIEGGEWGDGRGVAMSRVVLTRFFKSGHCPGGKGIAVTKKSGYCFSGAGGKWPCGKKIT